MVCFVLRRTLPAPRVIVLLAVLIPGGAAPAQPAGTTLVRQLYADVAIEVRRAAEGAVLVAAADGATSVAVTFLARDLRRWADSAAKVLVAKTRTRRDSARWRAMVEGPGVEAGSLSLSRAIAPPDTTISLLLADAQFQTVRFSLGAQEARAFVTAMRKAADAVIPAAPRRRGATPPPAGQTKPPATKPPATKPPAATPATRPPAPA